MADVTQLRFANLLRRSFGLKATDPGRVVHPVVTPTYGVADPGYAPESRLDRGERSFTLCNQLTNTAAVNFGILQMSNLAGSNMLTVIRRVTFSYNLPTAANQPGAGAAFVASPVVGSGGGGNSGQFKDGRMQSLGGTSVPRSYVQQGNGAPAQSLTASLSSAIWFVQVFPGAATQVQVLITDTLDAVIAPGTALSFELRFDTLPVATYTWCVCIEGYERVADQSELIAPPP